MDTSKLDKIDLKLADKLHIDPEVCSIINDGKRRILIVDLDQHDKSNIHQVENMSGKISAYVIKPKSKLFKTFEYRSIGELHYKFTREHGIPSFQVKGMIADNYGMQRELINALENKICKINQDGYEYVLCSSIRTHSSHEEFLYSIGYEQPYFASYDLDDYVTVYNRNVKPHECENNIKAFYDDAFGTTYNDASEKN